MLPDNIYIFLSVFSLWSEFESPGSSRKIICCTIATEVLSYYGYGNVFVFALGIVVHLYFILTICAMVNIMSIKPFSEGKRNLKSAAQFLIRAWIYCLPVAMYLG